MTDAELEQTLTLLSGRIAAIDAFAAHLFAFVATQYDDPARVIAHVMDGTIRALERPPEGAYTPELRKAALAAIRTQHEAFLKLYTRLANPGGHG